MTQYHQDIRDTDIFRISIHFLATRPVWKVPIFTNRSFPNDRMLELVRYPIDRYCRQLPEEFFGYQLFAKCDNHEVFAGPVPNAAEVPFQTYFEVRSVFSMEMPPDPEVPFTDYREPLIPHHPLAPISTSVPAPPQE